MKRQLILVFVAAWICSIGRAGAQVNGKNADAIILAQPMGKGATVIITYPGVVSHDEAKQRAARLARMAGWTISTVEVKDEEIKTRASSHSSMGKQTGLTMLAPNAQLVRDGGFLLQPFVQAFSDLRRIEVWFFLQKQSGFNGLREFESKPLSVSLVQDGGPYRYAIDIKEPGAALPNLPLTQPVAVSAAHAPSGAASGDSARRSADMAFVLMVATACALVVLVVLLVIARLRFGNTPASGPRRVHRS